MRVIVNVFFDGDGAHGPNTGKVTKFWNDYDDGRIGPRKIGVMEKWPLRIIPSYHDRFDLQLGNHVIGLFVTNRSISKDEVVIDTSCMSVKVDGHPLPGFSTMNSESKEHLFLNLEFSS